MCRSFSVTAQSGLGSSGQSQPSAQARSRFQGRAKVGGDDGRDSRYRVDDRWLMRQWTLTACPPYSRHPNIEASYTRNTSLSASFVHTAFPSIQRSAARDWPWACDDAVQA